MDATELSLLRPRRHLFVFSHLHGYSSLLSHILGAHSQIDGYCETHIGYRTSLDSWRLRRRVRKLIAAPLSGDYVLDEVLHDYPISRSILNSNRTRAVALARRPHETVRSIIAMGLTDEHVAWHRDFERVARYYETRLAGLLRLSEALRGRVVFIESETLLAAPRATLDHLSAFLELRSPLQFESRCFAPAGEPGLGEGRTAVSVPRPLTVRLQTAYNFWCSAIRKSCPIIGAEGENSASGEERSSQTGS